MRRQVIALSIANALALGVGGIAYIVYSRLLTPAEFGLYGIAFAAARFCVLVLDGGLKTAIIKHPVRLTAADETAVTLVSGALAFILLLGTAGAVVVAPAAGVVSTGDALFCAWYVAAYVGTYPLIVVPTAWLERELRYVPLSAVESVAIAVELAGAAPLMLASELGVWSFVAAAAAGRILRVAALLALRPIRWNRPGKLSVAIVQDLVKEGARYQGSVALSMIRDNLHVLIVAPWFGKAWAGYYAWALQLCMFSSQVFVAAAARISIPAHASTPSFDVRWENTLLQMRWLGALTIPILAAVWLLAPVVDALWFEYKWSPAIALLALLFARMVPGIGTSPLGTLVLVERGAGALVRANLVWTATEVAGALVACALLGPIGLAWSYALVVWVGFFAFLANGLPNQGLRAAQQTVSVLLVRPALWVSVFGAIVVSRIGAEIPPSWPGGWPASASALVPLGAAMVIVIAYLAEGLMQRRRPVVESPR
jgi:O-antigen/teichoic acid export membrane protein